MNPSQVSQPTIVQPAIRDRPKVRISPRAIGIGVLFAYLGFIFFLTHAQLGSTILDYKNFPGELQMIDKVYHFGSYSVLSFLVLFTCTKPVKKKKGQRCKSISARRLLVLCGLLVAYACFDELTQPYFNRRLEILDLIANLVGIAAGQVAFVTSETQSWRKKLDRLVS